MLKNKPQKTKNKLPPPKKKAQRSPKPYRSFDDTDTAKMVRSMGAAQLVGAALGGFVLAVAGASKRSDDDWHLVTDALPLPGTSVLLTVRGQKQAIAARAVSPTSWEIPDWELLRADATQNFYSSNIVSWRLMPPAGPQP